MTVYSGNQRMQQAQRAAAKKLAACPPDARARFEQFYAEALAQEAGTVQQLDGSFNPYAVEQTLIDRCRAGSLGEAVGTEPGSGVGWVPVPRGLAPIPDAAQRLAAYRAAPVRDRRASAFRSANGNAPADVDDDAPSRRTR